MYRFVLRPGWIVLHVVLLVLVVLFAVAGFWQLDRLDQRRARNRITQERQRMPEAELTSLLSRADDVEYRRVRTTGRYDTGEEVLLVGRGDRDRPGHHVLTPLVTREGNAILVDRGWVPPHLAVAPVRRAAPPGGRVTLTGVLLASEGGGGSGETRRLSNVDVKRVATQLPYPAYDVYLALRTQEPGQPGDLPDPITLVRPSEGSHLVYAVQWFLFIPIALIGYGAILHREARKQRPRMATA